MRLVGRVAEAAFVGSYAHLAVEIPGWKGAQSGQFAMIQAVESRCFLARPFSVSDDETHIDTTPGTHHAARVSFLVDEVGRGSGELAALRVDDRVHVLGPLGRGFAAAGAVAPAARRTAACPAAGVGRGGAGRLVIVAGGAGIAPLPLLLREIESRPIKSGVLVLAGFRSSLEAQALCILDDGLERLRRCRIPSEVGTTTEDGSFGFAGMVTDLLDRELQPDDTVLVCGPSAMCEAAWKVCRRHGVRRAWFSLETLMACGVGSCHGCVTRVADGILTRVCRRGPVMAGEEAFGAEEEMT